MLKGTMQVLEDLETKAEIWGQVTTNTTRMESPTAITTFYGSWHSAAAFTATLTPRTSTYNPKAQNTRPDGTACASPGLY